MRIEDIDFTPCYYGPISYESHRDLDDDVETISEDECKYLGVEVSQETYSKEVLEYFKQLYIYYQRFNNHMPIPLRKSLLREIQGKRAVES